MVVVKFRQMRSSTDLFSSSRIVTWLLTEEQTDRLSLLNRRSAGMRKPLKTIKSEFIFPVLPRL